MEQIPFEMIHGRPRSATQTSDTIDRNRAIGTAHRNMSARVSDQRVAPTETAEDGAAMFMSELLQETLVQGTQIRGTQSVHVLQAPERPPHVEKRRQAVCQRRAVACAARENAGQTRCFSANYRAKKNLLAGHTS